MGQLRIQSPCCPSCMPPRASWSCSDPEGSARQLGVAAEEDLPGDGAAHAGLLSDSDGRW